MGRNKKFKLTFHNSLSQRSEPSEELRHKSTCFTSAAGQVRVSTSIISTMSMNSDIPSLLNSDHNTDPISLACDDEDELLEQAYMDHLDQVSVEPERSRRKRTAGDEPLTLWLPERERYLEELINLEGRGRNTSDICSTCLSDSEERKHKAIYECLDCFGRQLQCKGCIVAEHSTNPLHRIREWNGVFFVKTKLKALGLRIQLGHARGERCANPEPCPSDNFTVIDTHAIHSLSLDFCGCGHSSQLHTVQLLRHRFYPATTRNPKTATTFRALEVFELLSYASKVSVFEYYQALSRLTDNTGTDPPNDRYPNLLLSVREWRYLKMMKRSGRGHDPEGPIAATKEGDCAVLCPACPHPDKNLSEGWENAPPEKSWLYGLFLGIDANFRLKRKHVSNDRVDPDLGQGFAYFVEEKQYKAYLEKHKDGTEPKSTCSRHDAVNLSNTKPGQSHAATGVGTIECARHNMKRPNAVGDLQFGERYCNMDYLFWRSLFTSKLKVINVSYDIACQWSINLRRRMFELDHEFFVYNGQTYIKFLVPKFHLPAHVVACRTRFSFNFTVGVGRTDGEAPERGWAEVNPLAASTKEMGPGSRRDTLDAHFGDYNWRKVIGMGPTLLRKLRAAANDMADQTIAHEELTASLPPETILEWTKEVEAWEKDPQPDSKKPTPYDVKVQLPTQAAVRLQMAESEASDLASGKDIALDVNITPSVLIATGLDLEAEQRSIKADTSKVWLHSQDRQKTRLQLRNNALSRKIAFWTARQQLYIPTVVVLRRMDAQAAQGRTSPLPVHEFPLWLPSQIKSQVAFDTRLGEIEWELRKAQADEALEGVRRNLQIRSYLFKFKDQNVRGQHANTRARNAIATVQARIDACAEEYRAAHTALLSLGTLLGRVGWQDQLRPLAAEDIRQISGEDGVGQGSQHLSWIWKTRGVAGMGENDEVFRDTFRIEWYKSRARAMRFTEEVALLVEEMERVLRFFKWQQESWRAKAEHWSQSAVGGTPRGEGLQAYAERQAALRGDLSAHFSKMWLPLKSYIEQAHQRIAAAALGTSHVIVLAGPSEHVSLS
ncbi:hypothetical protein B0H34DRAFT_709445 [Crassisporium funariophilum]|nr:hypothetical protein B0H34DRAFT_727119 [Crassisporium funariophilum]KAF8156516.1 hypothetical protein B0H34DRAFT_709445 [Crassisporium funariophilum]